LKREGISFQPKRREKLRPEALVYLDNFTPLAEKGKKKIKRKEDDINDVSRDLSLLFLELYIVMYV